MKCDEYFERLFEEKENIVDFSYCEVDDNDEIWDFNYTKEDMLKILQNMDVVTKKSIRDTLVKIDFHNGDINHFLSYVFTGYVRMQMGKPPLPRQQYHCTRCGHEWTPRQQVRLPSVCPRCSSPYWNKEYQRGDMKGKETK